MNKISSVDVINVNSKLLHEDFKEIKFKVKMNILFSKLEATCVKEKKMLIVLKIFKKINKKLPYFLGKNPIKWNKYAFVIFNKAIEFESEMRQNFREYKVKSSVIKNFMTEMKNSIDFLENYIKTIDVSSNGHIDSIEESESFKIALNIIANRQIHLRHSRPQRLISLVDYSGMDMNTDDEGEI